MADNDRLGCQRCGELKGRRAYRNQELQQHEHQLRANPATAVGPLCMQCSGTPNTNAPHKTATETTRKSTTGSQLKTNNNGSNNNNNAFVKGDQIKCGVCDKSKARMQYSNKQLQDWESRKRQNRSQLEGPKCRSCTGQPQTEWECSQCQKVMGKDKFAKSQRTQKENALCIDCSQERQDREPNPQDAEEEESILEEMQNQVGSGDSAWSTYGLRSTLPSIANSSMPSTSQSRADDGVWIPDNASQLSRSTARQSDSNSDTTTQMGVTSAVTQSTTGWASIRPIEQTHRRPRAPGQSSVTGDKFAKQGAVKKSAEQRAQARYARTDQGKKANQPQKDASDPESGDSDADRDDDDDDDDEWQL